MCIDGLGCDYDAVKENDMIGARMRLRQMSLKDLEKLADRHAQEAVFDDYPSRWSGLMKRFRLCEEIVSRGKRGHTNSNVAGVGDQRILGLGRGLATLG